MLELVAILVKHGSQQHRDQLQSPGDPFEFLCRQRGQQVIRVRSAGAWACQVLGHFDPDAAVADEAAGPIEHRLTADTEPSLRAIRTGARKREIQERLARGNPLLQPLPLRFVDACVRPVIGDFHQPVHTDAEHLQHRP